MTDLHQYLFVCLDTDGGSFDAYVKAESKQHATAIIEDRIASEAVTPNKGALSNDKTFYKLILKGARKVRWTMPSLT